MDHIQKNWVIGILLLILLFFGMYFFYPSQSNEFNGKSLVTLKILEWADNLDDSSELIFSYNLYNYGDSEATNVWVMCTTYNEKYDEISNFTKYEGNIASRSTKEGQMTPIKGIGDDEATTASCNIDSCDNCVILDKRILGLQ